MGAAHGGGGYQKVTNLCVFLQTLVCKADGSLPECCRFLPPKSDGKTATVSMRWTPTRAAAFCPGGYDARWRAAPCKKQRAALVPLLVGRAQRPVVGCETQGLSCVRGAGRRPFGPSFCDQKEAKSPTVSMRWTPTRAAALDPGSAATLRRPTHRLGGR